MLSFEWLIDPITPEKFFKDYYEREALLIQGRSPEKFSSLLSVAAIDRYLATATPCHPDVFLVDAARELQVEDYAFPSAEPPGRLDLPLANSWHTRGRSSRPGGSADGNA